MPGLFFVSTLPGGLAFGSHPPPAPPLQGGELKADRPQAVLLTTLSGRSLPNTRW
jgi:hypothetical protein